MRLLAIVGCLVCLAVLFAPAARAASPFPGTRGPWLSDVATQIGGTAVDVICEPPPYVIGVQKGIAGAAFVGHPELGISLSYQACASARHGRGPGMLALLHELAHTTGIADEAEANCYALERMRDSLVLHWGATRARAERVYRAAVEFMWTQLAPMYWCAAGGS